VAFDQSIYESAVKTLESYRDLIRSHKGVISGYWVGWKSGDPYIMVTVEMAKAENPESLLPDKLGDYDVYYMAGHARFDSQ